MFDRSFLPEAQLEFVLVSDTHYMLDTTGSPVEFESRRKQSARAERALRLIAQLDPRFVVHLGDLVQEYPETERYRQAILEARAQLERCGLQPYHVAGNQDIGDKPDPSMPTSWVTPESLASFHALFGRSWYSWDAYGLLDPMCNPRPVFNAARCLNTILFSTPEVRRLAAGPPLNGARLLGLEGQATVLWLLLPTSAEGISVDLQPLLKTDAAIEVHCFDLAQGTSQALIAGQNSSELFELRINRPILFKMNSRLG